MFEDKNWGWKNKNISPSKVILKGGEVYIANSDTAKNQSYFENIKGRSIAAFLGYHYGFAGFNADEQYLKNNFKIELSSTHQGNIKKS